MVIISHKPIREHVEKYPKLNEPLERWYYLTRQADGRNYAEIKKSFNTVDAVGNGLFVFNIKGNDCRLIARIIFRTRTVFIRFIARMRNMTK
jgi:mRNA interferase HigB